jgi:hypothetical protein
MRVGVWSLTTKYIGVKLLVNQNKERTFKTKYLNLNLGNETWTRHTRGRVELSTPKMIDAELVETLANDFAAQKLKAEEEKHALQHEITRLRKELQQHVRVVGEPKDKKEKKEDTDEADEADEAD